MSRQHETDRGERTRQALRVAAREIEPDMSRIVDGVPEIMAEARRRRSRRARVDPLSAVVLLAQRAIPAMAAAAALLVTVAIFVGRHDGSIASDPVTGVESFLLTGQAGEEISDVLLEAMTERGSDNG